jgi:hypothetical protein
MLGTDIITNDINITGSSLTGGNILKNGELFLHDNGDDSVFVGLNSGNYTGGDENVGVGVNALMSINEASESVAVGAYALQACTDGNQNTAVGANALFYCTTGYENTAIGSGTLLICTTGNDNTAVGLSALSGCTTGAANVGVGVGALQVVSVGVGNIGIGNEAGYGIITGNNNTVIGYLAGPPGTFADPDGTVSSNIVVGAYAGTGLTGSTNNNNILIANAGAATDNGIIRIGTSDTQTNNFQAGIYGVEGSTYPTSVVTVDVNGMLATDIITNNINITGSSPAGGNVLQNGDLFLHNNGIDSLFIGLNSGNYTGGLDNVGVGPSVLQNVEIGSSDNTAVGSYALQASTIGTDNTAVGAQALFYCTTGSFNTAIGSSALHDCTTGMNNTAVGLEALFYCTTGAFNVSVGEIALKDITTGEYNVGIGVAAGFGIYTGNNNTIIGGNAGSAFVDSTASSNIIIGYDAGGGLTGVPNSNNILIAAAGTSADNGVIRIGIDGVHGANYQEGIYGQTIASGVPVLIDSVTHQLGTVLSSERFKTNVQPISMDTLSHFKELRPVTFNYKEDTTYQTQYGFIAEQVEPQLPELVVYGSDSTIHTLKYHLMYALLHQWLRNVQIQQDEQDAIIVNQTEQLATKDVEMLALQQNIDSLHQELANQQRAIDILFAELVVLKNLLNQ